jgi:hypothetical protein
MRALIRTPGHLGALHKRGANALSYRRATRVRMYCKATGSGTLLASGNAKHKPAHHSSVGYRLFDGQSRNLCSRTVTGRNYSDK